MTYSAGSVVVPTMVHPFGPLAMLPPATTAPSAYNFESANRAVYFPILVPSICVIRRVWWANATVSSSYSADVGVYADAGKRPGVRLVSSGSTAMGTNSQVQFVSVTDTTIGPGLYWLAIAVSSGSPSIHTTPVTAAGPLFRFEEASAFPLPATATPVESTSPNCYLFGFSTTASP